MPTLNNWSVTCTHGPYLAPGQRSSRLQGRVYDHPGFGDGSPVITSRIIGKHADLVLTSSGSYYTLGTVDPNYEAEYPNAHERLLSSLPE